MADANTEKDYSEFHRRVETYVTDVEAHLKLPAGTVGFLGTSRDSDFVFVLKMCGVIEPVVKEAVRESIRQAIEHPHTVTSGSEALMKAVNDLGIDRLRTILFEFGAIDGKDSSFVQALFSIRNGYAHHIANAVLSVREVCEKIAAEPNGDRQLLRKLLGWDAKNDPPADFVDHVRAFMFYNAIFLLSSALHIVKPPPAPPGLGLHRAAAGGIQTIRSGRALTAAAPQFAKTRPKINAESLTKGRVGARLHGAKNPSAKSFEMAATNDDPVACWNERIGSLRKRGRVSAAALTVVPADEVDVRRGRPGAPARLSEQERELWERLIFSRRPGWFSGAEELLESYITMITQVHRLEAALRKAKPGTSERYEKLVRMHRQSVALASSLATRLRLTPHSKLHKSQPTDGDLPVS